MDSDVKPMLYGLIHLLIEKEIIEEGEIIEKLENLNPEDLKY